jgi:GNAT superfamily N-acetyltransferase
MIEFEHCLRAPDDADEWCAFHVIRRKVLFENRGKADYVNNHPDDFKPGNHPLILLFRQEVIGVVRIDICEPEAWLRRVAIREELQRRGHGRVLLRLAELFALDNGCSEIRTNAAIEAVGFYERCGYVPDPAKLSPPNSVTMRKPLR